MSSGTHIDQNNLRAFIQLDKDTKVIYVNLRSDVILVISFSSCKLRKEPELGVWFWFMKTVALSSKILSEMSQFFLLRISFGKIIASEDTDKEKK